MQVKVALPTRCSLGEGLHWDGRRNLLWFVDVYGPDVFWFDPDSGERGRRALPEPAGWVLSIASSDRVLVGLKSGIASLDVFDAAAEPEWLDQRFPSDPDQRLNDAKVDPQGRLWYGSVSASDESRAVGCLARYEPGNGAPVIVDAGYRVANGPAFNGDGSVMLHSDSGRRVTYRFDVDVATGATSNRVVWRRFADGEGSPDGMTFDADGCVWIAHWGAARLCRYDVHGNRLQTIQVPATHVTNVCFGGSNLSRLFATSASRGLDDAQRAAESCAGALFEVWGTNARGLPSSELRI